MSKNKKKKTGLQREVSSIFSGVPIPPKKGYNASRQPSKEPVPENQVENPSKQHTQEKDKQTNLLVQKPNQIISSEENNITRQSAKPPVSESTGNIPLKPPSQERQKPQSDLIEKLNQPVPVNEDNSFEQKPPEVYVPDQTGNITPGKIPLKPPSQELQKPQSSLIAKLKEPAPVKEDNNVEQKLPEVYVPDQTGNITSDKILQKPPSQELQEPQSSLIAKLNQPASFKEDNNIEKKLHESLVPEQTDNKTPDKIPLKPPSQEIQKPQSSLIQKLNQPTELLRKDTQAKQTVVETPKVAEATQDVISPSQWQQFTNKLFTPKPGVSPARQKATVILIPILALLFIFILRQIFWASPKKTKGAGKDASIVNTSGSTDIEWKIPEPYPLTLRDPMHLAITTPVNKRPEVAEEETEITIAVKGVLYSEDNPAALIGNKIVHVGEIVSGAKIVNIDRDSVVFEKDGKRWKENISQ